MLSRVFSSELLSLADDQHGLLTIEQIERFGAEAGALAAALTAGEVSQVLPGIVLVGNESWPGEEVLAWWLKFDPTLTRAERINRRVLAAASHQSAAYLLGLQETPQTLPTFKRVEPFSFEDRRVELIEAGERSNWTLADGVPVIEPVETIVDLLSVDTEIEHVASVAVNAMNAGLIDESALDEALIPFRHVLQVEDGDNLVSALRDIDGGGL